MIQIHGLDEVIQGIDHMEHFPAAKMNRIRAKAFTKFMTDALKTNTLFLHSISSLTVLLHGNNHAPMYNTGGFAAAVKDKQQGDISVAGWIQESGRPKGGKIEWRAIAAMHMSGYRIPLFGSKGARVRGYFAAQGIFFKKTTLYLVVVPRDILGKAYHQFELTGKDDRIIETILEKELRTAFGV